MDDMDIMDFMDIGLRLQDPPLYSSFPSCPSCPSCSHPSLQRSKAYQVEIKPKSPRTWFEVISAWFAGDMPVIIGKS